MLTIKRFFLPAVACGLLFASMTGSEATTFTLTVPLAPPDQPVPDFVTFGVNSDNGIFNAALNPSVPFMFTKNTNVSDGTTQIGGGSPGDSDTFLGSPSGTGRPAQFTFLITDMDNSLTRRFLVNGVIIQDANPVNDTSVDSSGLGSTGAFFQANSIQVDGGAPITLVVPKIPTGANRPSLDAQHVVFGPSAALDVYVEQTNSLTSPNAATLLSVGGYITVAVPEPGAAALLAGMGTAGISALWRRRARRA